MKIVNLETFRALPPGTVFSKYEPFGFGEIEIKCDTGEFDFFSSGPISSAIDHNSSAEFNELLAAAQVTGESLKMDFDSIGRDGCFEPNQLFAVWENHDVLALVDRLKRCIP